MLPPADDRPLLFMIGQPMCADGFNDLAAQFPDRTVVTDDQRPEDQAGDLHMPKEHLAGDERVDRFLPRFVALLIEHRYDEITSGGDIDG